MKGMSAMNYIAEVSDSVNLKTNTWNKSALKELWRAAKVYKEKNKGSKTELQIKIPATYLKAPVRSTYL